jgi:hypothetical protein
MHADVQVEEISSGSEDEAEKKNQDPTFDPQLDHGRLSLIDIWTPMILFPMK